MITFDDRKEIKLKEMMEVITACSVGKKIERSLLGEDNWEEMEFPDWNFSEYEYRVRKQVKVRIEGQTEKVDWCDVDTGELFLLNLEDGKIYTCTDRDFSIAVCISDGSYVDMEEKTQVRILKSPFRVTIEK